MSIRQDCSKSLAVNKMKMKAMRSHDFIPKGDWGKRDNADSGEEAGNWCSYPSLVGMQLYSCSGRVWQFLPQQSMCLLWDPLNHTSGHLPRETKIYVHPDLYGNANNSFIAVVRSCKELELSFSRWLARLCVVHLHTGTTRLTQGSFRDAVLCNRSQPLTAESDVVPR